MKFWESVHTFNHPWSFVSSGHWRKYPNPFNPAVLSTDIVERNVTPEGTLRTTRLLTMNTEFPIPSWASSMINIGRLHAIEHSEVNPEQQTLKFVSQNITFCSILTIKETITYRPDPTDSEKTIMEQNAEISVPSMSFVEKTIASTIATNSQKGREAMEWVVDKIKEEFLPTPAACEEASRQSSSV
eukprot:m.237777 g.237777  ORF g.237777 m.237777 type:complete len:186 (-) comp15277_c1_seq7:390-947(-)